MGTRQGSIGQFPDQILGLPAPRRWGPFLVVATNNGTNLDFMNADGEITAQHYAFLVANKSSTKSLPSSRKVASLLG